VGTLAAYGRPGDDFVFYELSPAMIDLAWGGSDPAFTFLADTPARVEVIAGDARMSLVSELVDVPAGRGFDLLVLDAFSGDGVPLHLLTREAFDIYASHLAADGMIAAHVSSNWVDLRPVLYAWARAEGWRALTVSNHSVGTEDITMISTWVLLFRDALTTKVVARGN
jgi:spermidine synthase